MPGRAPRISDEQTNIEYISSSVPKIFDQVQVSVANHQKNCVALHKIHVEAAKFTEPTNSRGMNRLTGEKLFTEVVHLILFRVLVLKKGIATADRVVKFIGTYIKFINEKVEDEQEQQEDDDNVASRFTARLLRLLLKGIAAKDKNIRYRVLQTLVEMISHLGEIDEDLYDALRVCLLDRVKDKEAAVRSQAIVALSKLCGEETAEDVDDGQEVASSVLLDALAHDPSSDVRRAVLLNLNINETTIPHILARMRDVEPFIRKLVISAILEPNTTQGNEPKVMGPTHPRALAISQREQIVKDGLGDREESVRNAATSLIGSWIDCINVAAPKTEDSEENSAVPEVEEGVLSLLKLFDLGQGTVAVDALLGVFTRRLDIFSKIDLNEKYWERLNPERAFLARVFVDHCIAIKDQKRLEEALPTVSQIAAVVEKAWNQLTVLLEAFEEERIVREFEETEFQQREEEICEQEIKLGEMLKIAVSLDYGDENGRRLMFPLIREMTSREILPEGLFGLCLDILKKLAANDRDLIRMVVEIISDLRDPFTDDPEEPVNPDASMAETPAATPKPRPPPREKTEGEKKKAVEMDYRCLLLSNAMLERVNTTFEENSTLEGLMRDLIVPSIHIKDAHIREKAFVSLGLCCSIARKRALNSVDFFRSQILSSPDKMKPSLYQIVFDMLMVHDQAFTDTGPQKVAVTDRFLIERLKEEQDPKVLATLCLGIAKLIIAGIARDINSVANLMLASLSPATAGNQELRQCLTGFFPVYSYMSAKNQQTMVDIFLQVFSEVKKSRMELEEDEEMATATQVANMFVDLTDPNRLASVVAANGRMNEKEIYESADIQLRLATEILKEFLKPKYDFDRDDKKVLCQMLAKLYIPSVVDDALIRRLKLYLDTVKTHRPLKDVTSRNALNKFDAAISKKFEKQLELKDEELRKLEELQDLFEYLDDIIPEDDGELIDLEPKRRGKKRRSSSVASGITDDETLSHESGRGKPKAKKRRRVSGEDNDSEEEDDQNTPRPAVKTRVMPKRAATGKIPTQPIVITDSEDEGYVGPPKNKSAKETPQQAKEEEEEVALDKDISQLLEPLSPAPDTPSSLSSLEDDSILEPADSEEDEEEDEVNDLLIEEDS